MYDALGIYPPSFYLGGATVVFSALLVIIPLCCRISETPATLEKEDSMAFLDDNRVVDESKKE